MATVLPVITLPNPLLRQRAVEVDDVTLARLRAGGFFDDLIATMRAEDGVGIAATQVGQLYRVFVALEGNTPRVYVNPVVSGQSMKTTVDSEGCLSVPGKVGIVERAYACTIRALDRDGAPIARKAKGLVARIWQHEVDHLNGVLFIDRASHVADISHAANVPRV